MKTFLMSLILIFFSLQAGATVVLVSDIDDTVRQTNVRDLGSMTVLKNAEFAGMATLYKDLANNSVDQIDYVTGAPSAIKKTSEFFLYWNGFPDGKVHARNILFDTITHKVRTIKKIIEKTEPKLLLMIGDNGEHDTDSYTRIEEEFSGETVIFMHQLFDDEIPKNQIPWLTSADLAVHFYALDLVSSAVVDDVLEDVIVKLESRDNSDRERVFPSWAQCKTFFKNYSRPQVSLSVSQQSQLEKYESFLQKRCSE
jgi:hypothetical protein